MKNKKCSRCGRRHEPFEKKTEILGYWRDTPIIKAYPEEGTGFLTFWCDFCNREHLHGSGNGHRTAHCADVYSPRSGKLLHKSDESPYAESGYFLNEVLVLGQKMPGVGPLGEENTQEFERFVKESAEHLRRRT